MNNIRKNIIFVFGVVSSMVIAAFTTQDISNAAVGSALIMTKASDAVVNLMPVSNMPIISRISRISRIEIISRISRIEIISRISRINPCPPFGVSTDVVCMDTSF
jgi:hypothetical protein